MPITLFNPINSYEIENIAETISNSVFTDRFITFKNKIINGNFDIWQRGTTLGSDSSSRYLADRWQNESVGTSHSVSQENFTLGQTTVPGEPSFFHRVNINSVSETTNYCVLRQHIESVRTLAGKIATLSFWAKADSNKNIAIEFIQNIGTGGSPSGGSTGLTNNIQLTPNWQKYIITVSIPSISSYVLGTNKDDSLIIQFWFDAGSSFNSRTNSLGQQSGVFDIAQVQLEEGSSTTPFEMRPIGLETQLCQRYFFKRQWSFTIIKTSAATQFYPITFPITMRIAPNNISYSNFIDNDSFGAGVTGITLYDVTELGAGGFILEGSLPGTTGWRYAITTEVSAEY